MTKQLIGSLREAENDSRIPHLGEIGLNQFAPFLINRISATYNVFLQDRLRAYDLTTAKMRALLLLSISPGLTVNDLAYLAVVEQSTMSRNLDVLETQGHVERKARAEDMRVRELHITDQGRNVVREIWPTVYQLYANLFEGVTADEYDRFVDTLHKVMRNMLKSASGETADSTPE